MNSTSKRTSVAGALAGSFALATVLLPELALAAGDGGHHEPSWTLTGLAGVNFVIFCLIMHRLAWPLVKEYLQDRHDGVVEALEAAARAKQEAETLKAEFEARMKSLEDEAARARAEVLELAQTEAKKLVAQAEKTADHIRRDAQLVADQEVARARRALQAESANLVTKMATELVASQITPKDQERFVADFLAETPEVAR